MSDPDMLVSPLTPDEAYAKSVNADLIGPMELLSPEPYADVPMEAWKLSGLAPRTCWLRSLEIPADEEIEWFEYAGVRVDGSRLTRDGTRLTQQEDGTWLAVSVPGAYNLQLRLLAAGAPWAFQFKARSTVRDVPVQIHVDALTERAAQEIARQQLLAAASMAPDYCEVTPEGEEGDEVGELRGAASTGTPSARDPDYVEWVRTGLVTALSRTFTFALTPGQEHFCGDFQVQRGVWLRALEVHVDTGCTPDIHARVAGIPAAVGGPGTGAITGPSGEPEAAPGTHALHGRYVGIGQHWLIGLRNLDTVTQTVTVRVYFDEINALAQQVSLEECARATLAGAHSVRGGRLA